MTLFDYAANRDRVASRIGAAIVAFLAERTEFRGEDLLAHVEREVGKVAPGSPDRILRLLRKQGRVNYRVVDGAGVFIG